MDEIEGDYSIYDLSGKAVSTGKASNQINVSSLPSGLYILTTKKGSLKFAK
ncbi:T9SS type A sorting domain-containing protein [Flavobacterium ovatum]|uniref:T9SS type A sorting domain-containing protein n=1 Tax=Flavobacterium ovatum TaxID=1928857 RepID=UPI00344DAC4B